MRMDVSASDTAHDAMTLYKMSTPPQIAQIALGSDSDIGGISRCHLSLEHEKGGEGYGRFYGTVSSQIPRNATLERSGYAAFRNKSRPTLFGAESWDTSLYPYLAIRIRNRTPKASGGAPDSLRSALHAQDQSGPAIPRAVHALGLPYPGVATQPNGPLFFVNVQTDGPVTTDLYQHRLWLDESKGDEWQTVTIPLDDFVLTNTGVVSESQVSMLREKVLSVGISVLLDPPVLPAEEEDAPGEDVTSPLGALRKDEEARGSKRDASHTFDLGVQGFYVVSSPEHGQAL